MRHRCRPGHDEPEGSGWGPANPARPIQSERETVRVVFHFNHDLFGTLGVLLRLSDMRDLGDRYNSPRLR